MNLLHHVPELIVIVYIDLLLEESHIILKPSAFVSSLIIPLTVSYIRHILIIKRGVKNN